MNIFERQAKFKKKWLDNRKKLLEEKEKKEIEEVTGIPTTNTRFNKKINQKYDNANMMDNK
jgi:hypothetical protein